MYLLLFVVLVGAGVAIARVGYRNGRWRLLWGGIGLAIATGVLFALLDFWGEALWFSAVGYAGRFWAFIGWQGSTAVFGALFAAGVVVLVNTPARRLQPALSPWAELAAGIGGGIWGLGHWQQALLFVNASAAGVTEPLLGLDAGFYLFRLPFLDAVLGLFQWCMVVATVAAGVAVLPALTDAEAAGDAQARTRAVQPVVAISAGLGLLVGADALLACFGLLYSTAGVAAGPGWTDANVRLPVYLTLAVLSFGLGIAPALPAVRERVAVWLRAPAQWLAGQAQGQLRPLLRALLTPVPVTAAAAWAGIVALWVLLAGLLPAGFQALAVEPNEITYEKPYIANNIRLTSKAFGLDRVEQRQYPAQSAFTRQTVQDNRQLISEIRLWDWRALDAVYKQFQEIRLYYEFVDVDMDRYHVDNRYRQIMVSARELSQDNLPAQSRTFVNQRFKYTHGYGLTLATVSDFTPEGLPNLLVKDIPPQAEYPSLTVTRPEIYYGELTDPPVVANSAEREFDHPQGEQNVYAHYAGSGGVEMRNLWRKFVFGWKLDGTRFLLSSYPRAESRIMIHRQIQDRVQTLAPFLTLDGDPYLALVDGRLKWIIDTYTTSDRFPYSQPFDASAGQDVPFRRSVADRGTPEVSYLDGVNYLRNSAKVIVDAYDGSVDFYVFDPKDPIINTWRKALPGMFKPRSAMPKGIQAHVRYPEGLLLTQGLVYAKYHMRDPEVFYNQEDLWVRATEKHYDRVEPVEPYYVMWQLPGSDEAEFVLMMPFTPKERQVLIGWIAGLCDGDNYGRFLAYQFPKERRVLGPQQVETKIDQDSFLAGQLTLWDQRGSHVIRGNVLAIPLDHTLLYVEPIYLQAETAAYPELRLVAVMHGDHLSYAKTFDEALQGLFAPGQPSAAGAEPGAASMRQLGSEANAAFNNYLKAQGEGRFRDAAEALAELQSLLGRLATGQGK
ncbi:MAG: UPF0182 family protein [Thiohalocapsa sp.]|uniref:UPF0182 family protein n=1 Tax=Thiohalocapsa sp. TaxID=2497641 RepID=UPI0025D3180A|nr:UPF0182 family protein [Thiohalocapsa sp.]MCG6942376.1 UPF0182 family protein [Thiohalocapsa sp.]